MPNLNLVTLCGHLSRDPEIHFFGEGKAVANVTIAVNTGYGDNRKAHFIDCKIWNKSAEYISEHARKGDALLVTGELHQESWETETKEKRRAIKVNCNSAQLLSKQAPINTPPENDGIPF